LARAGSNRSLAASMQTPIYMPLSTPAYAGEDIAVNDSTTIVQLNAAPVANGEIGQWTVLSGEGGSFTQANNNSSQFKGSPCNSYTLRFTKNGCSQNYDDVVVSFNHQASVAVAGEDQLLIAGITQTMLNAIAPAGGETGEWTVIYGANYTFTDINSPSSSFSGAAGNEYILRWTVKSPCSATADYVRIRFQ
jgi:hypothetical protein